MPDHIPAEAIRLTSPAGWQYRHETPTGNHRRNRRACAKQRRHWQQREIEDCLTAPWAYGDRPWQYHSPPWYELD